MLSRSLSAAVLLANASLVYADEQKICPADCEHCRVVERVVMEPQWTSEVRKVVVTEYVSQPREEIVKRWRHVDEVNVVLEKYVEMTPVVRTRIEPYVVSKPVQRRIEERVTVMVPHEETRSGMRRVVRPVSESNDGTTTRVKNRRGEVCVMEPYEYTVTVMRPETRTVTRVVTEVVKEPAVREVAEVVNVPTEKTREREVTSMEFRPILEVKQTVAMVPVQVEKEVIVPVVKMVARTIRERQPTNDCVIAPQQHIERERVTRVPVRSTR